MNKKLVAVGIYILLLIVVVYAIPKISFISQQQNLLTDNRTIDINLSITESGLRNLIFNWNNTNYTVYEDDLIMLLNFDNVSNLNENETTIKDASRTGNNASFAINSSWSRFVMVDSFNLSSNFLQGIAYDGNFLYVSYGGDSSFGNVIEKRNLNGSLVSNISGFLNNTDYEVSGISYFDNNLFVGSNGYPGSLSGNSYNKIMIFDTSLVPIRNITLSEGDYLEGVNKYGGYYWAIFDDYAQAIANISQYNSTWDNLANLSLRAIGTNRHKYQGISFYNDSSGNSYLFANIHEGTSPETLDKYLWNGTDFTFAQQLSEATEFGHQDIEIWNDSFFWVSREQNKSFITQHTYSNYFSGKYGTGAALGYNNSINMSLIKLNKNAGTIMVWIKMYDFKTTEWIFSEQGTANNNNEIEIYLNQSGDVIPVVWGGTTSNIPTFISLNKNQWTNIALTWNSTDVCAYKNGNLNGVCDITVTLPSAVATTGTFGKAANAATSWTAGMIDEARVYNRSLSREEIFEIYSSNLYRFNSTDWYLYINQTKNATTLLDFGSYTYQAFAVNFTSDFNQTALFNLTIQADIHYPRFSGYWDNNATISGSGLALFNATITNTNGTVFLEINSKNITARTSGSNIYNTSINLATGSYNYTWHALGDGIQNLSNSSQTRIYIVNAAVSTPGDSSDTGSGGSPLGFCIKDMNCKKGYFCYKEECIKELLELKILNIKIKNNFISLDLQTKAFKSVYANLTLNYWISKNNAVLLNKTEIITANLSEKEKLDSNFNIPANLNEGKYQLTVQLTYNNYTVYESKQFNYTLQKKQNIPLIFLSSIILVTAIFFLIKILIKRMFKIKKKKR